MTDDARDFRLMLAWVAAAIFLSMAVGFALLIEPAHAHWKGPTPIGSPDKAWWNSLHANGGNVPCCDIADGQKVEDVDWDTINVASADGQAQVRYRVRLNGQWIVVPPEAVVTEPNRFGPAVVWPYTDFQGKTQVRYFLPGAGA